MMQHINFREEIQFINFKGAINWINMLYIYCNIAYIIVLLNHFINMILYKLMLQTVNKNSNIKNSYKYTTILNYNFSPHCGKPAAVLVSVATSALVQLMGTSPVG